MMADDDDDPLASDGYSHRITISGNPLAMKRLGPNLRVTITATAEDGTMLSSHDVGTIVDTGSQSSCISLRMVPRMVGAHEGRRTISHVFGREDERTLRGVLRFQNGVQFTRDFAVLAHLDHYDVLIGRDILKHCRMYMDLGKGEFRLYFSSDVVSLRPANLV